MNSTHKSLLLTLITALQLVIGLPAAQAAVYPEQFFSYNPGGQNFGAKEWSYDLYGTWGSRDREDFEDDHMGFGMGVNYFFTRYIGASAETYIEDFDFPNHLDFSVIARYPLERSGIAPYVLTGFGRQFSDVSQWSGHLGGGAEYRVNPGLGFFADIRGVWLGESQDISLIRFGARLRF